MASNLQVEDVIGTTPQPVKDQNGNVSPLALSTDKVGIATSNPTQQLTLGSGNILLPTARGALDGNLYLGGTTDTGQIGMRLFGGKINERLQSGFIDVRAGTLMDGLIFRVDTFFAGAERMRITGSGNVGINTESPREKLEVNGNIVVTGNVITNGVSFQELLQRIKQLEQKVGELEKKVGGGTTSSGRQISVSKEGAGSTTVFTVTGTGFAPNRLVVIRITAPNLEQLQFPETAGADGKFVSRHSVSCVSGGTLTFTAFEDANPVNTQAVPIVTTCP